MLGTVTKWLAAVFGLSAVVVALLYNRRLLPEDTRVGLCVATNCAYKSYLCLQDPDCKATLDCSVNCQSQPRNKQAMCAYICEMTDGYGNEAFTDVMLCMIDNSCMSDYPTDGECVAKSNQDAVQTLTSMKQIQGDWWAIRGLNCGFDDLYPGGYDWFPCQHERWTPPSLESGSSQQWINNITYCAGSDNRCVSKGGPAGIRTIANATLVSPGVIRHEYDSPLAPQVEHWRVVSMPTNDYMLVYWCGKIPIQEYNGGLLFSRSPSAEIPQEIEAKLTEDAAKFGMDFGKMCASDNSWCPKE